jgi:hypothetical protein
LLISEVCFCFSVFLSGLLGVLKGMFADLMALDCDTWFRILGS